MILPLIASLVLAAALGLPVCRAAGLPSGSSKPGSVLWISLAVALGFGLASAFHFLWLLLPGGGGRWSIAGDALFLSITAVAALRLAGGRAGVTGPLEVVPPRAPWVLVGATCGVLISGVTGFAALSLREPHGGWDAWMTWNLHARFLFRGGEDWLVIFSDAGRLRHADYPFLVPTLVARSWTYIGAEAVAAPAMIALLMTAATVGVVAATIALLRTGTQALLAAVVLVSVPFFVAHGASQFADVPVGLYLAVSLALICLHEHYGANDGRLLVLAGLAAGLGAWTKNEGLLFLVALGLARFLVVVPAAGPGRIWREARPFAAGALPVLGLLGYFKVALAPPNDLMSSDAQGLVPTLERVLDPGRYLYIVESFVSTVLSFGRNGVVSVTWLLLTYAICLGIRRAALRSAALRTGLLAIGIVLAGHFAVFLTAPADMERLLDASIERLFLQLFPASLLLYFLVVRTPEETIRRVRVARRQAGVGDHSVAGWQPATRSWRMKVHS